MNIQSHSGNQAPVLFPQLLLPVKKIDLGKPGIFQKNLNAITAMYGLAYEALDLLKKGQLSSFDALATDCSCHLRAFRLVMLAKELLAPSSVLMEKLCLVQESLKEKQTTLSALNEKLVIWCQKGKKMLGNGSEFLTPVKDIHALQDSQQSTSFEFDMDKVIIQFDLSVELPSSLIYAINAFMLTLVKDYKQVKAADKVACADCEEVLAEKDAVYKETTLANGISQYALKHVVKVSKQALNCNLLDKEVYRLAKKHLTLASANFVIDQMQAIGDIFNHTMLVANKKEVDGKVELPDYYSLTSVFHYCSQKDIVVLLKIKQCMHAHRYQEPSTPFEAAFLLIPDQKTKAFKPSLLPNDGADFPVIVVEGKRSGKKVQQEKTCDYLARLMKGFDFLHFCQLDGAQHKQYTSDAESLDQKPSEVIPILKDSQYVEEGKKLDRFKLEAQASGCAFHDQSLLILSHIFADTFKRQMKDEADKLYLQTAKWIDLK
ncbi:conserved hypothetical protein [Candidatus Protochlamydia naegleriophila]|uniref:Uncharacterized protein n=1 Tax=Candidatus Protochlamydia naegleriophila TaxID=389348 RepID=A0A0U5J6J4_9BACT|nr:hypothetical protein [Candidatus Protochlamydia naegleriophila]CUI15673.1 conserved hypothetical protein [Candidatus Protochlamydia naegleriophila]